MVPSTLQQKKSFECFAIYDCETTGFPFTAKGLPDNPRQPRIIQHACMRIHDSYEQVQLFSAMTNNHKNPVPPDALKVHGITHTQANAQGIPFRSAAAAVHTMISHSDCVVGWNTKFDMNMLEIEFSRANLTIMDIAFIDLMEYFAKLHAAPGKTRIKLTDVTTIYGLEHDAHDALGDVHVTAELFAIARKDPNFNIVSNLKQTRLADNVFM